MARILISDIDGTLLKNGKIVADKQKIGNFRKSNTFVLCTGRNYTTFCSFVKTHSFYQYDFAVLSNGAMLVNKNLEILYSSEVSLVELKDQIPKLTSVEGIARLFLVMNLKELEFTRVVDLLDFINKLKDTDSLIGLTIELLNHDYAEKCFNRIKESTLLSIQHNHNYIDIVSKGTNKKSGILKLVSNIKFSKLQVIGDGENDIPMFEMTEESYTFHDAPVEVKNKANFLIEFYDEIFKT